jgi:hypothetical protein
MLPKPDNGGLDPAIQRYIELLTKRWMRGSSPRMTM